MNTWFMGYWICLVAVLLMIVAAIILPQSVPLFIKSTVVIAIGGAAVSACVLYLLILRKLWSLIPANQAKTSPGKTVGFCLIPFFGLYWNFIAIHGLAKALNVETNQNLVENRKVNEGLSLSVCIVPLTVFGALLLHWVGIWIDDLWISALGNVLVDIFGLALFVLGIILLRQMKNAGIALIQKQLI
ncbi:MAG: hypothetical protein F4Z30_09235 [Gemmatimonadetes bacterium]|nr:hypothetical protein [Gemmatimonadota bacterium]